MSTKKPTQNEDEEIRVTSGSVLGSTYAQVAVIGIMGNEVTMEFIFLNPQSANTGQVVSRVTMPIPQARHFAQIMEESIEDHINKNKK